jgi:alcohol dehydrogenase
MVEAFSSQLPVRVRFGDGVIGELEEIVGARSALVVVEEPVAVIPEVAAAIASYESFMKRPGEPTVEVMAEATAAVAARRPQVVVGIGGGSALDMAKAARVCAGHGVSFEQLASGEATIGPSEIELVLIPTTSGTGSEVTGAAVAFDPALGRKTAFALPIARADHALVDPQLTLGLPPSATSHTGVDALAQGIGGVIVSNSNPLSVAAGLEACRHIAAGLEPAVRDGSDLDARREMSLGSLLAGLAINLADCGADHALGHAAGSVLGLPHGLAVGVVLPECLEVNRPACVEKLERVADALGQPDDGSNDGSRAVAAVRRMLAAIGLPSAREAGLREQHVDRMTEIALDDYCLTVNPRPWSEADVRGAYEAAIAATRD